MKSFSYFVFFFFSILKVQSQENPSTLYQTVNVASYPNANFRIEGQLFIDEKAKDAGALPFAFTSSGGKFVKSFFDRFSMESFKPNTWNTISISGKLGKADNISVGAMFSGKAKFYFDDFKLFIKTTGSEIEIPLINNSFEGDSLVPWYVSNLNKASKIGLTEIKFNSGEKSLLIDNSSLESNGYGTNTRVGKYADINGIKLYYEIYGSGEPLLLIHGNNESIASFDKQIPELAKSYMVIALDSRGQGNSTSDSTKLTYELFAEDVNKFLDYLNIKQVNVLGWSDGGNIALILALKHPERIRKIAVMAAVLYNKSTSIPDNINNAIREQLAEMEREKVSVYDMNYRLKTLLLTEPNINPETLTNMQVPALIMAGKNDIVKEEHTKLIAQKIPQSTLRIFKGTGHEAPKDIPEEFNKTVLEFFNNK